MAKSMEKSIKDKNHIRNIKFKIKLAELKMYQWSPCKGWVPALACEALNKKWSGCEIPQKYADIANGELNKEFKSIQNKYRRLI